jgi:hypothetical protein
VFDFHVRLVWMNMRCGKLNKDMFSTQRAMMDLTL